MKPDKFLIGVWAQPCLLWDGKANKWVDALAKWQRRGVNLLITGDAEPKTASINKKMYCELADDHGMRVFMYPSADPSVDLTYRGFYGWAQPDEPDGWNHLIKKANLPAGTKIEDSFDLPASTQSYINAYNRLKTISPNTPIYGNFGGGAVGGVSQNSRPTAIKDFIEWSKGFDIGCNDFYLTNTGRAGRWDIIGQCVEKLAGFSGGKPQMAFVECSDQKIQKTSRCPTPGEFRAMVWNGVIYGAIGIAYFPQCIGCTLPDGTRYGGFAYDIMPPDVEAEMTRTNAMLTKYSDVLIQDGTRLKLDGNFRGVRKVYNGTQYDFILNQQDAAASYGGDNYGPYEVKVKETSLGAPKQGPTQIVLSFADGSTRKYVPAD